MPAVFIEWLNENAHRAYPLREDTPRTDTGGLGVTLPDCLLVDFVLTLAGAANVPVYLSQVAQVGGFLTLVFTDGAQTVTTLSVNAATHARNQGYTLAGQGDYEDARGRVVLGDLTKIRQQLPDGVYAFAAELEPGTVRPDIRNVRSLQVGTGDTASERIFGHVKLLEGSNIQLTYLPAINAIRIDALSSAGFHEQCECAGAFEPFCVRRINGVAVEDVQIIGDGKCLEVTVDGNIIRLSDKCSEPCCGCPELEFITTHLELLQSTINRLEVLAGNLQSRYQEFIDSILSSTKGSG